MQKKNFLRLLGLLSISLFLTPFVVSLWAMIVHAAGSADLKVFTSGPLSANNGDNFSYTVTIQNGGLDPADGSTFVDTFPAGSTNIVATCTNTNNGATCPTSFTTGSTTVQGTVPVLPYNGSVEITISGRYAVPSATSVSNRVVVNVPSGMTELDSSTNDAQTNTTINVRPADLSTVISQSTGTIVFGQPITYTITHTNNGPGPADRSYVTDYIYLGYASGYVQGQLTYSNFTVTCNATGGAICPIFSQPSSGGTWNMQNYNYPYSAMVPYWPSSGQITFTVTLTPVSFTNTTTCGPSRGSQLYFQNYSYNSIVGGISDNNGSNNQQQTNAYGEYQPVPTCPEADLVTTSTQSTGAFTFGTPFTYTIKHKNNGPNNASGSYLTDYIYLTYWSGYVQGQLTYSNYTVTCSATGGVVCPTFSTPSSNGTINIQNYLYPYSSARVGDWPTSGEITFSITITPVSFTNTTTCGPSRGSSLYFYNYAYASIVNGITDPNSYNSYTSINSNYGEYQPVPTCPEADLVTTSTQSNANWKSGVPLTYTIKHKNNGPSDAIGSQVYSYINNNNPYYTYENLTVTCSATGGVVCPATINNVPSMNGSNYGFSYMYYNQINTTWPTSGELTYTVTFTPISTANVCSNATENISPYMFSISNPPSSTTDNNSNNNYQYLYANYSFTCVDLTVRKTVSPTTIAPSVPMTFTLEAGNAGPGTASGAKLEDILPAGFLYTSGSCTSSAGGSCGAIQYNTGTRAFSSIIPTLPNGGLVTYTLYGTALGYSSIWSNIATISVDPLYSLEKSPSTNRAQVNFSIIGTDPIVRKVALDKAVQPGGTVRYQLTVINPASGELIEQSKLTDMLPTGFVYESTNSITLSNGATRVSTSNPTSGDVTPSWGSFQLYPGATAQVEFVVRIPAMPNCTSGYYNNSAVYDYYAQVSQTGSRIFDGGLIGNNGDDISCYPAVSVIKTVDKTQLTGGDMISWNIKVMNTGAFATTGLITLTDSLNTTLSGIVISSTGMICGTSTNPLVCTVPIGLAAYTGVATATITAQTSPYATTNISNTINYSSLHPIVCGLSGCTTNTSLIPLRALIDTKKTVDKTTITGSDILTYTLELKNNGTDTNLFPIRLDEYPDLNKIIITQVTTQTGIVCPPVSNRVSSPIQCTVATGALPVGSTLTMTIKAQTITGALVNNTNISNSFNISPYNSSQTVWNSSQNNVYTYVQLPSARLNLTKTVDKTQVGPGDQLTYTINVGNSGAVANVGEITLHEQMFQYGNNKIVTAVNTPAGVTCPAAADRSGNNEILCSIATGALAADSTITITIVSTVKSDVANRSWIYNNVYPETRGDVTDNQNTWTSTQVLAPSPLLNLYKRANKAITQPLDYVTYTLTIGNSGTIANTGTIILHEQMFPWGENKTVTAVNTPAGITCPDPADRSGSNEVLCSIATGALATGQVSTITITTQIKATTPMDSWVYNYFYLQPLVQSDNVINVQDTWAQTYIGDKPFLTIKKTVDQSLVYPGDTIHYTLSLINSGTQANTSLLYLNEYPATSRGYTITNIDVPVGMSCPDISSRQGGYVQCTVDPGAILPNTSLDLHITAQVNTSLGSGSAVNNYAYFNLNDWSYDIVYNNGVNVDTYIKGKTLVAYTDSGSMTYGSTGSMALFANDMLAGNAVSSTGVVTGSIMMDGGISGLVITNDRLIIPSTTPVGSYTVTYQVCDMIISSLCDQSTITVNVVDTPLIANPDTISVEEGGSSTLNLLSNDTKGSTGVTNTDVIATLTGTILGITTDGAGNLLIAPSVLPGVYTIGYQICQKTNLTVCTTSYVTVTVTKKTSNPGYAGGGGGGPTQDNCPNGDYTASAYDGSCGTKPVIEEPKKPVVFENTDIYNTSISNGYCYKRKSNASIIDSLSITTTQEFKKSLTFLYAYDMTMFRSIDEFDPYRRLTREEAAKIFSNFAINVLCRKPDKNLKISYSDVVNSDPTLKNYITLAYQLGLMKGGRDGKFRPFDTITKAEFNAVLIRMILKSYLPEDSTDKWYIEYNDVSADLGIIKYGATEVPVIRNDATVMLFRAYKEQKFDLRMIDYETYVLDTRDDYLHIESISNVTNVIVDKLSSIITGTTVSSSGSVSTGALAIKVRPQRRI